MKSFLVVLSDGVSRLHIAKKCYITGEHVTRTLCVHFSAIKQVLNTISNKEKKTECRHNVRGLFYRKMKSEAGITAILWDEILQLFQMTKSSLQSSGEDFFL